MSKFKYVYHIMYINKEKNKIATLERGSFKQCLNWYFSPRGERKKDFPFPRL